MKYLQNLTLRYFSGRALPYWCVLAMDCALLVASGMIAYYWTHGGGATASVWWRLLLTLACWLPLFAAGMRLFHTYEGIIRYSSFVDLIRVTCSLLVGFVLVDAAYFFVPRGARFPLVMGGREQVQMLAVAMLLMWGARIVVKYLYDTTFRTKDATRVFIYGVRQGGISIAKSMRNQHPLVYLVKGFVSSEAHETGRFLVGTHIHSASGDVVGAMRKAGATMLFVSPLCSDEFRENEALVNALMKAGIKIMMMPAAQTWDGKSDLNHEALKEVDIEDLLPRDKIEVDMEAIGRQLRGRRILITGAAGSIGSEMVRQVAAFGPSRLVLIDQAETPMHDVRLMMERTYPETEAVTIVTSITNASRMEAVFREHRPEYVFHAAAYKHVPMMEDNPSEAVQNNVYGTRVIADLAVKYGTRKFVMISTDKAVNPTNVMGCSKRICEIYCQSLNAAIVAAAAGGTEAPRQEDGSPAVTQFVTTRFGNVLGSNGSVIPLFKEQIRKGGPVTVTHPEIIRFFMLIPEACKLVLEAGTMGRGGEIFVFDMGKPVRIADLARRMIDLSGAKEVEIRYTGLRDGEKLYEEVLADAEQTKPTEHPKIKIASAREYAYAEARANEERLYAASFAYDDMATVRIMKEIVPEFKSRHSKYEALDGATSSVPASSSPAVPDGKEREGGKERVES